MSLIYLFRQELLISTYAYFTSHFKVSYRRASECWHSKDNNYFMKALLSGHIFSVNNPVDNNRVVSFCYKRFWVYWHCHGVSHNHGVKLLLIYFTITTFYLIKTNYKYSGLFEALILCYVSCRKKTIPNRIYRHWHYSN